MIFTSNFTFLDSHSFRIDVCVFTGIIQGIGHYNYNTVSIILFTFTHSLSLHLFQMVDKSVTIDFKPTQYYEKKITQEMVIQAARSNENGAPIQMPCENSGLVKQMENSIKQVQQKQDLRIRLLKKLAARKKKST